jgi:two-component system chemotaxis response regulator CheY
MSKLVLTVDDSRTMRDMLHLALSEAGYRVVQAVDGVNGLEVLELELPDIIVTDINMPRMDGFGFIEGVRKHDKHRATPILVLTTESDSEKKLRARLAGATGWIVKPFNPAKLVDAVRRVAA